MPITRGTKGGYHHPNQAQDYRDGYPNGTDNPELNNNLAFYRNELPSSPDGDFYDNIVRTWWGQYSLIETHHAYIQWLFPIREQGLNPEAHPLQPHEAQIIKNDPILQTRVRHAYEFFLDFLGMRLASDGTLSRSLKWKKRYKNFNDSFHNYLRVTRVLKCLGEVGLEHLKLPFLKFVIVEIQCHDQLENAEDSMLDYWFPTLRSDEELAECKAFNKALEQGGIAALQELTAAPTTGPEATEATPTNEQQQPETTSTTTSTSAAEAPTQEQPTEEGDPSWPKWLTEDEPPLDSDYEDEEEDQEEEDNNNDEKESEDLPMERVVRPPTYPKRWITDERYKETQDLVKQGIEHTKHHDAQEATICFSRALKNLTGRPHYSCTIIEERIKAARVTCYLNRSECHQKTKQWDLAIADCNAALEINPTHVGALCRRANYLVKFGNKDLAWEDAKAAQEIDPDCNRVKDSLELLRKVSKGRKGKH
eukprot:TRINITY_DN58933_c1_g1_i1.p1 TRINITY_DN58933_c1_g1~~TRINITY_DN58933_c1_g1_i1.p1  ORF type:complete len:479 (-),score=48.84 TRINITY_DN58933_c1_g1_i1:994-2430(-)